MTRAEYNERFLRETEGDELTPELKDLFAYLSIDVLSQKRFDGFNEEVKKLCHIFAYEALLRHWRMFNPEKGEPYPYFVIIIRSSVAGTWCKYNKKKS